ncbi:hypothetical protein F5Y01DRAFT_324034 [Xylaria sp. FL0043]|nr:hypothetical protein F5Y01DRAFT_324034 [Xylaria sp. FL0043]
MAALPSLITFGSLTPLPSQDQILQLNGEYHRKASLLKPLIEAVRDLDSLWTEMTDQDPVLDSIDGKAAIRKLKGLSSGTVNEHFSDERRNILIVPITVLNHVVQYLSFIEHIAVANHNCLIEIVAAKGGVQGLCAGLLSAQAVASARTVEDIVALSCTSLRLAFCIGAYVDADQMSNDGSAGSATLAVRWADTRTLEDIQQILQKHRNTYIAATRDERDITITTPAEMAIGLREDLLRNDINFLEIGLNGRYHTDRHADIPAKIIKACEGRLDPRFGNRELVRSNFDGQIIPRHDAVRSVLESILVQPVRWYQTISTAAQSIGKTDENSYILSIGGDTTTQSMRETQHVVRVKSITSADSFHDLLSK